VKTTFIFPESWKLPSFSPEKYRANKKLPIKAYKMLFHYQKFLLANDFNYTNITTLIFIDPKDELVSLDLLQEYIQQFDLYNLRIIELSSNMNERQIKYHHLIVDKSTMGEENWNFFLSSVNKFLSL
jgi:hypothetical protein